LFATGAAGVLGATATFLADELMARALAKGVVPAARTTLAAALACALHAAVPLQL
jgi:hypothetical protein